LDVAIDRARTAGELVATASFSHWPGFRRRVRDQIAAWSRQERSPISELFDPDDAVQADEWAIYGHYRSILSELRAEDEEGFANWASRALEDRLPTTIAKLDQVTVLDLDDGSPSIDRALRCFEARARTIRVGLIYDANPALAEVYAPAAQIRERLLARGYAEATLDPVPGRPAGLRAVEAELFRSDAHARKPITDATGLAFLGAPQGDGLGLIVAREVRRLLMDEEGGARPEDLVVVVPAWNEDAEVLLGVLRSWGLPVSTLGRPRTLRTDPSISALRRALRIPEGGVWEAAEIVRLLRHGRLAPQWREGNDSLFLARAAAAVRDSRVFGGRDAIVSALARAVEKAPSEEVASQALEVKAFVERLFRELATLEAPGTWSEQTRRLLDLAFALGLARASEEPIERLGQALREQAMVREAAGESAPVSHAVFLTFVDRVARDLDLVKLEPIPGTVALGTWNQVAGARARFIILTNLVEGSFPVRAAIESAGAGASGLAFGREMKRFLRVLGAADERVILAWPTQDENGQELLRAVFLDALTRRVEPETLRRSSEVIQRLDPALVDRADLARAPADARVRAVALACVRRKVDALADLATRSMHRAPLEGTAHALSLTARRLSGRVFSVFDGRLADPAARRKLGERFGPANTFSASQLESYLSCPFQFFAKYVLNLKAVDDRDDLDEDLALRGSRVHRMLEEIERQVKQDGGGDRLAISKILIQNEMRVELSFGSEADRAREEIELKRVEHSLRLYAHQMTNYEQTLNQPTAHPALFEVAFGRRDEPTFDPLTIGEGPATVRLQGKIDRVDIIESPDGSSFRVIDYKTGAPPPAESVKKMVMVQLLLYALAVERLGIAGDAAALRDIGPVKLGDWEAIKPRLEEKVLEAVRKLRSGVLVVQPAMKDCDRTCDYATVCRIGQVRKIVKSLDPSGIGP
jgi:hypothetical protein